MIKDNQKVLNRLQVVIDSCLIIAAYHLAYWARFEWLALGKLGNPSLKGYMVYIVTLVPIYLILYRVFGLYGSKRSKSRRAELLALFKANIIGVPYFAFIVFMRNDMDFSRWFIAVFTVCNIGFAVTFRMLLRKVLRFIRKNDKNLKHVLIVGYSRAAEGYIDRIMMNPAWGYKIHGILDDTMVAGTTYRKISVIGTIAELKERLEHTNYDEIAIALSINEYGKLEKLVAECERSGVHTKFIPDYHNIIPTIPYMEDLDGLPVINIRKIPLSNHLNELIKRMVDIVGAFAALLIFGIPMILITVLIKKTSEGPVIFSQIRVGRHNKEFKMYKFRSMEVQKEYAEKSAWTTKGDPRVTPIGKFIRKTSLDELPQLFNILKGDMSLVGPRPERPFFVEKFKDEIPRYMIKHQVRPGMTGWAQINGYRGDTSIRKRIEYDLYYIENWTLGLDFKILFMTIFTGFVNKNAY